MKKFLLGTTALGMAALFSTSSLDAAIAEKPSLRIDGKATFSAHIFDNSNKATSGAREYGHGTHFGVEDSKINFRVGGRMDWFGTNFYEWVVGLNGATDAVDYAQVEDNYLRVKGEWGTTLFGAHQGVESIMSVGAFSIMGATGGFDGNFTKVINLPTGTYVGTDMVGATKRANGFTYITPRVWHVQLGVTYKPSTQQRGPSKVHNFTSNSNPMEPFDLNSWAGGVNYKYAITQDAGLALSATGIVAQTKRPAGFGAHPAIIATDNNLYVITQKTQRDPVRSYALGGVFTYRNTEWGVEYINNGKSRQYADLSDLQAQTNTIVGGFKAGKALSAAAAWNYGPDRVSLGHYRSVRKFNGNDSLARIYSVTYDRTMAPGFVLFAEYNTIGLRTHQDSLNFQNAVRTAYGTETSPSIGPFEKSPAGGVANNNAHSIIMGSKFRF
jgi:hypothetical protein